MVGGFFFFWRTGGQLGTAETSIGRASGTLKQMIRRYVRPPPSRVRADAPS